MPAKNVIKVYVEDSYYHVYNRGVEKRDIFLDDQDYRTFLHLLKIYLSPNTYPKEMTRSNLVRARTARPVSDKVTLVAYCLMPNHFHLLIKQRTKEGMVELLRKLATTYSMYFNDRYDRVGSLFQGTYKAALIDSENYFLHLSRYIHLNPLELTRRNLVSYEYSSYPYYLGEKHAEWVNPKPILSYFHSGKTDTLKKLLSYQEFVESPANSAEILGSLTLD